MDQITDEVAALREGRRRLHDAPAGAAALARAVLQTTASSPEALLLLGAALRRSGNPQGARDVLQPLAVAQPTAWGVQFEAGAALAAQGDAHAALPCLTRATDLNPRSSLAWLALGDQRAILNDEAGAAHAHAQSLAGSLHDPRLLDAARLLLAQPDCETAAAQLADRFGLHLRDPMAVRLLGEAGLRLDRPEQVERLLEPYLVIAPDFAPLRHIYALALKAQHKDVSSLQEVERLLTQHPRALIYLRLKGALLVETTQYDEALKFYTERLRDHPTDARLWLSHGHVLKILGRQSDCAAAYRRSLALSPTSGEAYWSLANLKVTPFLDGELSAMADLVRRNDVSPEERAPLHYAYAKALEDAGHFEHAFAHYSTGARLRRARANWDAQANTDYVQHVCDVFTPELLAKTEGGGGASSTVPIFIVGLPRSGSTLVEQILASHTQVEGLSERPDLMSLARRLAMEAQTRGGPFYPMSLHELDTTDLQALGRAYLAAIDPARRLARPCFVDKFPSNFMHLGLILMILPQARIVDVRRHPMGCCFSAYKQYFAHGQDYSYDLTDLGLYYRDYVTLMTHFDGLAPGRIHRVHYEDLVGGPEGEIRGLLDHCGLEFQARCLRFEQTRRPIRTASSEQVRQPLFDHGIAHWRRFEPWLAPLKAALGPVLHDYRAPTARPL